VDVDQINALAQEIRRVDGDHSLGAGALAEAVASWIETQAVFDVEGIAAVLRQHPDVSMTESFEPEPRWERRCIGLACRQVLWGSHVTPVGRAPGFPFSVSQLAVHQAEAVVAYLVSKWFVAPSTGSDHE